MLSADWCMVLCVCAHAWLGVDQSQKDRYCPRSWSRSHMLTCAASDTGPVWLYSSCVCGHRSLLFAMCKVESLFLFCAKLGL